MFKKPIDESALREAAIQRRLEYLADELNEQDEGRYPLHLGLPMVFLKDGFQNSDLHDALMARLEEEAVGWRVEYISTSDQGGAYVFSPATLAADGVRKAMKRKPPPPVEVDADLKEALAAVIGQAHHLAKMQGCHELDIKEVFNEHQPIKCRPNGVVEMNQIPEGLVSALEREGFKIEPARVRNFRVKW